MEPDIRRCVIPTSNMPRFEQTMVSLQKRAKKLGLEPISFTYGKNTTTEITVVEPGAGPYGTPLERRTKVPAKEVFVKMTPPPHMAGWKLLAIKENLNGDGFVNPLPGVEHESWMDELSPTVCQHCNLRRNRNDVFLLLHEDGRRMQVGRACLADFLPMVRPEELISRAEYLVIVLSDLDDMEKSWDEFGHVGDLMSTELVIQHAAMAVRKNHGFVSKKEASFDRTLIATSTVVETQLAERTDPTDEDKAKAQAVIAGIKALPPEKLQIDFFRKIYALVDIGRCRKRHIGLLSASMSAWGTKQKDEAHEQLLLPPAQRQFVGTPGEKGIFTVRLDGKPYELIGNFTSYLHFLIVKGPDGNGHSAIWKGSYDRTVKPDPDGNLMPVDEWFQVQATVQAHQTYTPKRGKDLTPYKQTVFRLVKLVKVGSMDELKKARKAQAKAKKSIDVGTVVRFKDRSDRVSYGDTATVLGIVDNSYLLETDNGRQIKWNKEWTTRALEVLVDDAKKGRIKNVEVGDVLKVKFPEDVKRWGATAKVVGRKEPASDRIGYEGPVILLQWEGGTEVQAGTINEQDLQWVRMAFDDILRENPWRS